MSDLGELLSQQATRWHAGDVVSVETLLAEYSVDDEEIVLDLIYAELLLREERGESPSVEEYCSRFPKLVEEIQRQFLVHSEFSGNDSTLELGSTFDDSAVGETAPSLNSIDVPGFELLKVLGRGGSAVAYLARDEKLNRTVAIKLLSDVDATDTDRRTQLVREAEAAASLVHPAIVRIHQVGETGSGVPFMVMDYVDGGSVADLMQSGPLPATEAAAIVLKTAQAIQYAHGQNIIHRDLKPGNILLDDNRQPYVCDFGLARKLSPDRTRQTTNIVGTPAYMPPEQARGETVDERADIYSLGATLYEMLVGRSPFHASTTWDTLFQVMTSEPVSIRKLNNSVPLDLETICAKCIDKRADRRYETAAALVDDLQRFLANRPISARRVSTFEAFRRWCARNRALAGSLLVGLVLATALLVGSVVAAVRFQRQNERLVRSLETSIEAADQLLVSVTEDTQLLPKTPGSQEVSRRLLERARQYYQAFLEENRGDTRLRFQLARTHAGLALVAGRMDDLDVVKAESDLALELLDLLDEENGANEDTLLLRARVSYSQGVALQSALRSKDALPVLETSQSLSQSGLKLQPDKPEFLEAAGKANMGLANAHLSLGDTAKSIELLKQAEKQYAALIGLEPEDSGHVMNAARIQNNLGNSKRSEGSEVARQHYSRAVALLHGLPESEQQSVAVRTQLAATSLNLGMSCIQLNEIEDADKHYSFAIKELQRLVELEPVVNRHKYLYAIAVMNSGNIDNQLQNFERLASRTKAVVPVVEKLIEAEPENLGHVELKAMLSGNIALAMQKLGKLDEAIVSLRESQVSFRELAEASDWSPDSTYSLALNQYMLAQTLTQSGDLDDAAAVIAECRQVTKRGLKKDSMHVDLRIHELDLFALTIDVLEARNPVPSAEILSVADAGLLLGAQLDDEIDDYLVDGVRATLILTKAEVFFDMQRLADADGQAELAINLMEAEFQTPYVPEVRELFCEAHVRIGLIAREMLKTREGDEDLVERLQSATVAAKGFGATDEELQSLQIEE